MAPFLHSIVFTHPRVNPQTSPGWRPDDHLCWSVERSEVWLLWSRLLWRWTARHLHTDQHNRFISYDTQIKALTNTFYNIDNSAVPWSVILKWQFTVHCSRRHQLTVFVPHWNRITADWPAVMAVFLWRGSNGQRPLAAPCWTMEKLSVSCGHEQKLIQLLRHQRTYKASVSVWTYNEGIVGAVGVAAAGVEMGGVYPLQHTDEVWTVDLWGEIQQVGWLWSHRRHQVLRGQVWSQSPQVSFLCSDSWGSHSWLDPRPPGQDTDTLLSQRLTLTGNPVQI